MLLIELDAFSGRPNPRWELDYADSNTLRALIAGLPASSEAPAEPAGLGYRGFICIDAGERFLEALRGVSDPERKRKIIGKVFIDVFREEAAAYERAHFLGQGTLYPDVIESVAIGQGINLYLRI